MKISRYFGRAWREKRKRQKYFQHLPVLWKTARAVDGMENGKEREPARRLGEAGEKRLNLSKKKRESLGRKKRDKFFGPRNNGDKGEIRERREKSQ